MLVSWAQVFFSSYFIKFLIQMMNDILELDRDIVKINCNDMTAYILNNMLQMYVHRDASLPGARPGHCERHGYRQYHGCYLSLSSG